MTAPARSQERPARELVVFGAVYGVYVAGRWLAAADFGVAREHAGWVLRLERSLHIAIEGSVQRSLWVLALPVFAAYPVAPPRLAGIGLKDTVSHQAAVALTGHSRSPARSWPPRF